MITMFNYDVSKNLDEVWNHPNEILSYLNEWVRNQRWAGISAVEEFILTEKDEINLLKLESIKFIGFIIDAISLKDENHIRTYFIPLEISKKPSMNSELPITLQCRDGTLFLGPAESNHTFIDLIFENITSQSQIKTKQSNLTIFTQFSQNIPQTLHLKKKSILGDANTTNTLLKLEWSDASNWVMKIYRIFSKNPELIMLKALSERGFSQIPHLIGWVTLDIGQMQFPIVLFTEFMDNSGDGGLHFWNDLNAQLRSWKNSKALKTEKIRTLCEILGKTISEFHYCSSKVGESLFIPAPINSADIINWREKIKRLLKKIEELIDSQFSAELNFRTLFASVKADLNPLIDDKIWNKLENILKIKIHQDLHLSQMLTKPNNDETFALIDFEGDPLLTIEEKFAKDPIFRDLASIYSAFHYIKFNALKEYYSAQKWGNMEVFVEIYLALLLDIQNLSINTVSSQSLLHIIGPINFARQWERYCCETFLKSYIQQLMINKLTFNLTSLNSDEFKRIFQLFRIERLLKELFYELQFRKEMIIIPLLGLLELLKENY